MSAPKPAGPGLPRAPPSQWAEIHVPEAVEVEVWGGGNRLGWVGLVGIRRVYKLSVAVMHRWQFLKWVNLK